jgi:hypothetical protein
VEAEQKAAVPKIVGSARVPMLDPDDTKKFTSLGTSDYDYVVLKPEGAEEKYYTTVMKNQTTKGFPFRTNTGKTMLTETSKCEFDNNGASICLTNTHEYSSWGEASSPFEVICWKNF